MLGEFLVEILSWFVPRSTAGKVILGILVALVIVLSIVYELHATGSTSIDAD